MAYVKKTVKPKNPLVPDIASTFMANRTKTAKLPAPEPPPITPAAYIEKATTITPGTFTPKLKTLTSWSYSVYGQYLKCPLSVCFDKIKRIRIEEPPNPAFEKGNRVHGAAEQFIIAQSKKPPVLIKELESVRPRLEMFRQLKAKAELEWAFTIDWKPTEWMNWANAWLRIKTDVCGESPKLVQITDWKTGKIYEEHKQQRSLYGLGGLILIDLGLLAKGDKQTKVVAEHAYTDTGQLATEEYTMKDLKPLKDEWLRRIKQMMNDTKYPAKTGFHCRYCKFRKSNGGPCPENM